MSGGNGRRAPRSGDPVNRRLQRNQWVLFSVLAGAVALVFVLWLGAGGDGGNPVLSGIEAELASTAAAEAGWVRQSENRLGDIETRLREMETRNRQLEQDNVRLQTQLSEDAENARDVIDRQAALIEEMSGGSGLAPAAGGPPNPFAPAGQDPFPDGRAPEARDETAVGSPLAAPLIRTFELENPIGGTGTGALEPVAIRRPRDGYVAAGSYAEAVVLAGADASAGVQSQGDPRPVLLRLTGPAYGAAVGGVAEETDIEGCTVTGAAYGDLSSEKVYVRLQTMACAGNLPGTVIETPVSGFVAGGGKAGVRGPVVSREGALVQRAFLSGVFSGAGESVNQAFRPQAVLAGGGTATFANTDLDDIGRAGLGSGAGTAGREVSDYLIRRAEQYQPVIQLAAGTPVTVVFLEGAWLDGRIDDTGENQG